jgi:hypothetical protein
MPLPGQKASIVAHALVTRIFKRQGVCSRLPSDRGRNFTFELIRELCRLLGIRKLYTSPYRPLCNGQAERFHRTLHASLAMYADPSAPNWDETVSYVLCAYRSLSHSTAGYSPYMLAHSQEMRGPNDRDLAAHTSKNGNSPGVREQVANLARKLPKARKIARENIRRGKRAQRIRHDQKAVRVSYTPVQLVYRKQVVRGCKSEPKWLGPYPVVQRVSDLVYKIRIGPRETNVNTEKLTLCRASREELRLQRKEIGRQRREQHLRLDRRSESSEGSTDGSGPKGLGPEKDYTGEGHQRI